MKSRWRSVLVGLIALRACSLDPAFAMEPAKTKTDGKIREGAYYEFRGHVSDRDTIQRNFTLGWEKGSQKITVTAETKIFRQGRAARLEEAKAGDAARGVGQAINGKLVAVAVAFGSEGVELPRDIKVPDSITLPPTTRE